jgi:hypothetical protein
LRHLPANGYCLVSYPRHSGFFVSWFRDRFRLV